MILDDAEVHLRVANHREDGLGRDLGKLAVVAEPQVLQVELLLVDGRGRKERRVDALLKPLRCEVTGVADLPDILDLVIGALRPTVAQGDVAADFLTVFQFIRAWDLAVAHAGPAGVQPEGLGKQDELLSVVSDLLVQVVALPSGHHEVIRHAREGAVADEPAERLWFAGDQLDVQPCLLVDLPDLVPQDREDILGDGFVPVLAHGMPCLDRFEQCHICFPLFFLLGSLAQRTVVRTAVERDAVSVQHTEDACPAGVTAGFPDVVDGVAGVVHADDGLVPILAQAPLGVGPDLAAALQPLLGPPHGRSLGGEAGDGLDDVVRAGVGEELSSRIDPVVDAHKAYFVLPAEVQEDPELADAAQRVAVRADDHDVLLAQACEHPTPLRAVLLLGAVFFYDVVAAEPLHPRKVFVPGGEVLREEKVSDSCHVACCSLPLIYEELLTHQMILGIILHTVPA